MWRLTKIWRLTKRSICGVSILTVKLGDVEVSHFVILGQPFIMASRMETKVLNSGADYLLDFVWSELPFSEFPYRVVLMIQTALLDYHPIPFFNLTWSKSMLCVELTFVLESHLLLSVYPLRYVFSDLPSRCHIRTASSSSRLISSFHGSIVHVIIAVSLGITGACLVISSTGI